MSNRTSIHSDKTTTEDSEEQRIHAAQQALDLISEYTTQNPFDKIVAENFPSTLEEEDILSSSPLSPILSEHFPSSDREHSGSFSLNDERLGESKKLKQSKPEPVFNKFNIVEPAVPQYQESVHRHQSLRPDTPSSVILEVPVIKEVSADKEIPVPVTQQTPEGTKKTHSGVRTSSKVSSTTTITELPQNASSNIKSSSTADQVIMIDEPKRREGRKLKSGCFTGLLLYLMCSCCCSRCKKMVKTKKNEQSLPTTNNPPKTEAKIINKRRRNYCICCLVIIIIILLLLLVGVILFIERGKSPTNTTNSPANNTNNGPVTNTPGNPNISQSASFCLSTFNALVPSLARNFSCDSCGVDDTFYNITEFCVLKGLWANTPNKTALESQGWVQSKDFCKWIGVICDSSGNIIEITLTNPGIPNRIIDVGKLNTLKKLTILGIVQQPSGKFPEDLLNLTNLESLNIQFTNFTSWPDSFDRLSSLKNLTFARNLNFGTSVPRSIGSLSLTSLSISGQGLTGNIPDSIVNSKTLQSSLNTLDFSANSLTGSIPSSLSQFHSLITLNLEINNLSTQIPDFSTYASAKSIRNLQLDMNGLTGQIPTSISSLTNLVVLQLQNNRLSGNIPSQIGSMNGLQALDLSHNGLTGSIPDSVAALNVPKIDLSSNSLSGTIPSKMCQNTYTQCNLSSNNLTISGNCGVCLT
jgi:Leucine-rich repeat (LRR) protein